MDREARSVTASDGSSATSTEASRDLSVVAIGASAGGISAIAAVLAALRPGFPGAVVIVQHLDPHFRSYLATVLARESPLPVREVTGGELLRRGVVYVAPPAFHVVLRDGKLILTDTAPVHFSRPSVDVLFASVAAACGPRAIGVILTGAGVDGADGLRAIKSAGGRTIVQEPRSAEHHGMPMAASATGCVDFSLPLGTIGPTLARLVTATAPETASDG
jgi:two-component system, chemotaxis family, protein-glutamate methylesterase/glutaminase